MLLWGSVAMNIINMGLYTVYVHAIVGQKFIAMNIIMLCYVNYCLWPTYKDFRTSFDASWYQ